jgi:carbon storage regulator CsrA
MLVLSRKIGEDLVLALPGGVEVVIRVLDVRHRRSHGPAHVRLGITAPPDVVVYRSELREHFAPKE